MLREEVVELRKALELEEAPYTLETWEASGTQTMRDGFAARAIVAEWGSQPRALQRLGFQVINKAGQWKPVVVRALADKVLNTPGVKAMLDHNLKNVDETWEKIIERQREIALMGNDEAALKAAVQLAKFEGRFQEAPKPPPTVSLQVLVNAHGGTVSDRAVEVVTTHEHDPLAILSHEPSDEGVAIDTGDKMGEER